MQGTQLYYPPQRLHFTGKLVLREKAKAEEKIPLEPLEKAMSARPAEGDGRASLRRSPLKSPVDHSTLASARLSTAREPQVSARLTTAREPQTSARRSSARELQTSARRTTAREAQISRRRQISNALPPEPVIHQMTEDSMDELDVREMPSLEIGGMPKEVVRYKRAYRRRDHHVDLRAERVARRLEIVRAALEFRDVYSHERPTYASLSKSDFVDLFYPPVVATTYRYRIKK